MGRADRTIGRNHTVPSRIALFLPNLDGGGAQRVMVEVAKGLAERGLTVDLLLVRAEGPLLGLAPEGVRVVNFNSWMAVASLPKLVKYLKRARPDVLLSTLNCNVPALIAKKFFAKDLRVVVRQENTFSMQLKTADFKMRAALRLQRRLLPFADAIIAVSSGTADDLRRDVPKASHLVRTIWNPVVSTIIAEKARLPVEHPWFNAPRLPVILSVGRLAPEKDQPTLLRAFAQLVKSRPARLVILGEGPDRKAVLSLSRELGITKFVDFPGFDPNPFPYMEKAKVFALSSRYEGLGNVLIEAMACGTPVVSTDCPNGPREILEDGKWGRLVPVGDWLSLSRAISETLDHPADPNDLISRAQSFAVGPAIEEHIKVLSGTNH